MIVYILVLISVIAYLCNERINANKKRQFKLPPELPNKQPIIGHAHILAGNNLQLWKALEWISRQSLQNGGIVSMAFGPKFTYAITDPDDCLTIANACPEKGFYFYKFSSDWLGDGLLTGNGPTWKHHRKCLNPAFNQVILDEFMPVFNNGARQLIGNLDNELGKGPFKHLQYLSVYTLKAILQTILGINEDIPDFIKEYIKSVEQMQIIFTERLKKFWLHSDFMYSMTELKRKQDVHLKVIHRMSNMVIHKRKKYLKEQQPCEENTNKKILIDLLVDQVSNEDAWTDKEIRDEVTTFIVAGYDTTSFVLTFALIVIGSYPNVQKQLYEELREVFGDSNRDVERSDLSRLVYTEAVLNETMRLYPLAPIIARYANSEVKLKNYVVPSGSTVLLLLWGLHRHSVWGPDANEFRPARWLNRTALPEKPIFSGFGIGKRNCIGKNYAMISMKTTLAHILRRYEITADVNKLSLKIDVMLKPAEGNYISLELR